MEISLAAIIIGFLGLVISFANGIGAGFVFLLILIASWVVLGWVLSFLARRQQSVLSGASPQEVGALVNESFSGVGWKQVGGRGMLNFQARGFGLGAYGAKRPVISIDIAGHGDGSTQVDIWTSEWQTQVGMMALCDRVVSKKFWLIRKLAAPPNGAPVLQGTSQAASLPGQATPHRGNTPAAASPNGNPQSVTLADPGLPADHPRQLAHQLLTSVGVAYLFFGQAAVADCFRQLVTLSPVLSGIQPYGGGDFLGVLPGQPGVYVLAFEGQFGSAISVCLSHEANSDFTVEQIAMRLNGARPPMQWGIGTVGGKVPQEFARIVDGAPAVELYRLQPR